MPKMRYLSAADNKADTNGEAPQSVTWRKYQFMPFDAM